MVRAVSTIHANCVRLSRISRRIPFRIQITIAHNWEQKRLTSPALPRSTQISSTPAAPKPSAGSSSLPSSEIRIQDLKLRNRYCRRIRGHFIGCGRTFYNGSFTQYCGLNRQYDPSPSSNTTTAISIGTLVPPYKGSSISTFLAPVGKLDLLAFMNEFDVSIDEVVLSGGRRRDWTAC